MTAWERDDYASRYKIAPERLKLIPFYYFDDRVVTEPREWSPDGRVGYLSTGKNSCDWSTVIQAAEGQNWPLTIACKRSEFDEHSEAAGHAGIEMRSNIPRAEHDEKLAHSQLLIVALKERRLSAGHVRLMTAATYGTPVIATRVSGIRGYEELAAALVEPGDAESLRAGVASLMADPDELREQMNRVRSFARSRPYSVYASELRSFVLKASDQGR
ncbi:glycosyltransferase [Agromyces atrinae]|uniref:Glycosyltransferase n=1 Tax=Agromyces atrinae TaxID=592376 RepID=A0A4Q2M1W5_9MICO|nr:glycosyltransferase [Agromyces atrinae]NYD68518.1 uncharacterized protein YunC (DUF1805 family) [Agromyces atrinae]RXZ85904.1 glycosyltransferase [Agromyces atrinae]